MSSNDFQWQKTKLEYAIGQCQNVINSVVESSEMPEERKMIYLDYERPRLNEFRKQLDELQRDYWGSYYGFSHTGTVIGQ